MTLNIEQKKLIAAIESNDFNGVVKIIKNGCSADFTYEASLRGSPLYLAVLENNFDIAKYLVEKAGVFVDENMASFFTYTMNRVGIGTFIFDFLQKKKNKPKKI